MNTKTIARIAAAAVLVTGTLVACSDQSPACAAEIGRPAPKPYRPSKPSGQRTTSKVQDKPRTTKSTTNPYWKSSSKPTTWGGYNTGNRNWNQPYRKNMPVPQQPVIVHVHNHDYRTYPGYSGYYPVGVWPVGYGARYGCSAEREAAPESTPSPAPTVTVTVPATPTPTETPR